MAFLAALAGCGGGGDSHAASFQLTAQSLPASLPSSLPPKSPALPPAYPVNPTPAKTAFNCATGAVTCVEVASTGPQTQASLPVTFGQPFKAGDWKHTNQDLIAQVDGTTVPLQTDEISSHRDGSARFAVLSAQLANVQPGQKRIINLFTAQKTNPTFTAPVEPDWNLELEVKLYDANNNVVSTLVALPQAQLKTQIAQNAGQRLKGAVASEYTVVTGFKDKSTGKEHPHLTARLHTRLYDAGQRIRTDVVMENTRTWTAAPGNLTYDLAIKRRGTVLYQQPKFTHYHHARWHKVVWTGSSAEPQARLRHNMPYFMASKAVWNYDLSINLSETFLSNQYATLNQKRQEQASLGPMANLLLTAYFPTSGGRAEIGPLPRWTVSYLLSQDDRAREVMLANADASAAVPVHYRDETTNNPVDLDKYPSLSLLYGTSTPTLPALANGTTIWTPDTAHQGSYSYLPYLVTGDTFYLDELTFWAAWNLAVHNPDYRNKGAGLVYSDQVRGQAWIMRSLGEAYRSFPDAHPMKKYFASRLQNNLDWYWNRYYSKQAPVSPLGDFNHTYAETAPWQNDFAGIIFSQLSENGDPKAKEILDWISKFNIGRFQNESNGYCMANAPAYWINVKDASGAYFSTWKSLFDANFPGVTCSSIKTIQGYPDSPDGYAAYARAMMAAAANSGVIGAREIYTLWVEKTPLITPSFSNDPTWAIVPR